MSDYEQEITSIRVLGCQPIQVLKGSNLVCKSPGSKHESILPIATKKQKSIDVCLSVLDAFVWMLEWEMFCFQISPVSQLGEDHEFLSAADFQESMKLLTADSKASMLHGMYRTRALNNCTATACYIATTKI